MLLAGVETLPVPPLTAVVCWEFIFSGWLKCIGLCYVVCLLCERDVVEVNGIDLFIGWQW